MPWLTDEIDFSKYEQDTECKAKIRPASVFEEELAAEFAPKVRGERGVMTSTKLGRVIEFRPAEVTVWGGFNGHRKSMFLGQVALDLMSHDERCLKVSLEMLPRKTLYRMCRQALANSTPDEHARSKFLRWTDERLWLFDHVGRLDPKRALAVCRYFADELKGQHVFIDSVMKVCESEESLDEQKQLVGDICDVAKETGLHIHLVAHCKKPPGVDGESRPPTKYDIRGSASISDQSHNICLVWMDKTKDRETLKPIERQDAAVMDRPDHLIVVEKQRNGEFEGKVALHFDRESMRFIDNAAVIADPYRMEASL